MSLEVFTEPWAAAFGDALNRSEDYRQAASAWEGPLVLSMAGPPDRAVYLDLWHGECREARVAADADAASFVIRADAAVWQRVLSGDLEPIWGLMSGQLALTRGSIAALVPFGAAAKQLVAVAASLDSRFPA